MNAQKNDVRFLGLRELWELRYCYGGCDGYGGCGCYGGIKCGGMGCGEMECGGMEYGGKSRGGLQCGETSRGEIERAHTRLQDHLDGGYGCYDETSALDYGCSHV